MWGGSLDAFWRALSAAASLHCWFPYPLVSLTVTASQWYRSWAWEIGQSAGDCILSQSPDPTRTNTNIHPILWDQPLSSLRENAEIDTYTHTHTQYLYICIMVSVNLLLCLCFGHGVTTYMKKMNRSQEICRCGFGCEPELPELAKNSLLVLRARTHSQHGINNPVGILIPRPQNL